MLQYPVVVFSKNYCPYCRKAEELLSSMLNDDGELHVIDLMQSENFSDIQDTLERLTNRRTVPNIYIGGRNMGGYDEISKLDQADKLKGYLERAQVRVLTAR